MFARPPRRPRLCEVGGQGRHLSVLAPVPACAGARGRVRSSSPALAPGPVAHMAGPACGGGSWGLWWQSIELLQASRSPGAFREEIAGGIEDKKVSAKGRLQGPWEPLSPGNKGPQ